MNLRSLLTFLAVSCGTILYAQDCGTFYQFVENASYEYGLYDHKDKSQGRQIMRISDVTETGGAVTAKVNSKFIPEKKNQDTFEATSEVSCEDGTLHMDISMNMTQMTSQFSEMEVSMEGDPLMIPSALKAGQTLPDATTKIKTGMNGMSLMTVTLSVTDRKVEGMETITTPAGTFECYKITQTTSMKTIMSKSFTTEEFYAEGVGLVRSNTYKKNGKLESYQELLSLEK
ncbi:TapB family protein [Flavilitoribacter nigricans]|uniref:DUF3108 domain-containing protein n=1 Tax=Flavilitoribacter nigricans (strain ATCC 23147 / DSM 23189 / NBRC 102662 / NCIMB 1420 / SS-2) TaxID=1122177 RepID=A0A2D0NK15_FLAN2|nr:hypothetical protein [Flavilitoribacter nigricans]PHN08549.1 hypothetical protein CRP01_01145 [Flavilitoribacter nigricans DSM 23189 = NBRC 102662]